MMLEGRYAGRFRTALSSDLQHVTGLYTVQAKSQPAANGGAAKPEWIELRQLFRQDRHRSLAGRAQRRGQPAQHDLAERTGHGRRLRNSLGRIGGDHPTVTPRTIQIGASFAIVLVAYSAYALLAVPLIETQIKITGCCR